MTKTTTAPAPAVKPDRAEIRRALDALTVAGQTFEIRAIDVKVGNKLVAKSRVCHTVAAGVAAAVESWTARGTYFTLNPLKPDLEKTARDADVLGRHWLLVDIDAVRGVAGVQNATEAEKQSAIELGYAIRDSLAGLGWPPPIVIDSGNGYHLLYRIQLPNDDESRDLVKSALVELARRFDNDAAKVDTGVFNAARISKLPGTVVRKAPCDRGEAAPSGPADRWCRPGARSSPRACWPRSRASPKPATENRPGRGGRNRPVHHRSRTG
jgi:hypothetical protein